MKKRAMLIAEIRVDLDATDDQLLVRERQRDTETGFFLHLDVVEAQFAFDDEGMPTLISGRVRGCRVQDAGAEQVYAATESYWMDLAIGAVPRTLADLMGQMRADAHRTWKLARGAK